jgi:hypothetical protein
MSPALDCLLGCLRILFLCLSIILKKAIDLVRSQASARPKCCTVFAILVSVTFGVFYLSSHQRPHPVATRVYAQNLSSVFLYYVTAMDQRFPVVLGSTFSILSHAHPEIYSFSVNLFFFNQSTPDLTDEFAFLSAVFPSVRFRSHAMLFQDVLRQTNTSDWPDAPRYCRGDYAGKVIILMRLFVPLYFEADWFFYLDDDVMASRDFFDDMMRFTSDREKVMFSIVDDYCRRTAWVTHYLRRQNHEELQPVYFGSGVLLMRGGAVLRQQLRNVVAFLRAHPPMMFPDQDALNFAWNRSLVQLLPWQFCVLGRQLVSDPAREAYLKHYADKHTYGVSRKLACFAEPYYKARDKWKQDSQTAIKWNQTFQSSTNCP